MSVSELLTPDIQEKAWSNLYVNSLTANNLNFENVTVQNLTATNALITNLSATNSLLTNCTASTLLTNSATVVTSLTMNSQPANSVTYLDSSKNLSGVQLNDGQLLIGATGTHPFINGITGITNQVNVANGPGSITLSTPQDIATTSSPTFSSLSLTAQDLVIADNNLNVQSIPNVTTTTATFANVNIIGTNIIYNAGTFTVNKLGSYLVTYTMTYATNANGYRQTNINVTSSNYTFTTRATSQIPGNSVTPVYQNASEVLRLNSGDSFVIQMFQSSGGALNANVAGIITIYRLC